MATSRWSVMWLALLLASAGLQWRPPTPSRTVKIPLTQVPLPHLLLLPQRLSAMITTHALQEAHAVVYMSMANSASDGDAAPWNLQPAAMTIPAAALRSIPSVILMLELADWYVFGS